MTLPSEGDGAYISNRSAPEVMWASNRLPYMGWAPRYPRFEGILLSRLRGIPRTPKNEEGKYGLTDNERRQRKLLEDVLKFTVIALDASLQREGPHYSLWPIDTIDPRLPSTFGFKDAYRTEKDARRALMQSQNAFIPWIALTSAFVALHRQTREET